MRFSLAAWTVLALCTAGAEARADDLTATVPDDAFFVFHSSVDPAQSWIDEYYAEVLTAVIDADFPGLFVDQIAPQIMDSADLEQLKGLRDLIEGLLRSVPWASMVEHEMIIAERIHNPTESISPHQFLAAFRLDAESRIDMHKGLVKLMKTCSLLSEGEVDLVLTIDHPGDGVSTGNADALASASRMLGSNTALIYDLRAPIFSAAAKVSVLSVAFHGDDLLISANVWADSYVRDAIDAGRGRAGSIASMPAYAEAFAGLPMGSERTYFDLGAMLSPMRDGMELWFDKEFDFSPAHGVIVEFDDGATKTAEVMREAHGKGWGEVEPEVLFAKGAFELMDLFDVFGTMATVSYIDGQQMVTEHVMHLNPPRAGEENWVYNLVAPSGDEFEPLLEFVPADAASFSLYQGFDLVPMYTWARAKVAEYVPDGERYLAYADAAQAFLDMDLEHDLLPLMGSPAVSIQFAPDKPSAMGGDWIIVSPSARPEVGKRFNKRIVKSAQHLLPLLMDALRNSPELGMTPLADIDLRIVSNDDGIYRSLDRIELELPFLGSINAYWGYIGEFEIMASSEDAVTYVLETIAGEQPNILEAGPVVDMNAQPTGPTAYAHMSNYGADIQGAVAALQGAGGYMGFFGGMSGKQGSEEAMIMQAVGGIMSRVGSILSHIDYLGHSFSYSQVQDEGRVLYTRTSTHYKLPEERGR